APDAPPPSAPAPAPSDPPSAAPAPAEPPPAAPAPAAPAAPVLLSEAPSTTVLFPIRAANLGPSEVRAAEILFRRRYEAAIGRSTVDESRVAGAVAAADDNGLFAACQALGCTRWITVDLVRLDKEVFVIAIERDGAGAVLQRIETEAPALDALPGIFDRVARALAARVPLEQIPAPRAPTAAAPATAAPAATAEPPAAAPDERRAENAVGFKFGLHGPLWPDFQIALSHAFVYRREVRDRFFEINAGFTAPLGLSDQRAWGMVYAEVGLFHVFPSTSGAAWYAGGGFGPRIGGYDDLGFGAGVYGAGGVMMGRNGSSRVYAQIKLGGDAFTSVIEPYVVSYAGLEAGVGF
ncbi:MAG: hypothetical protein ACK4YP_12525, partial [Myxococcota bacterium]